MSDRAKSSDSIPAGSLPDLLRILDLDQGADQSAEAGPDTFVGQSQPQPWRRIYGGQVLAQALVAAQRTVDPVGLTRPVHSMHAYFLRAGDDTEPITFGVERLRDGQSFTARRVHAIQFDRPILTMAASFQLPATGLDHAEPMPDGVPPPQSLPTLTERYAGLTGDAVRRWLRERPMDLRHVGAPSYVEAGPDREPCLRVWMRSQEPIPAELDTPALHAAVLAYASDYSVLEPILRRHGRSFADPALTMASLDHAMWFHRPARVDGWLLNDLSSPSAQGARGLGQSRIYTADGVLVASVAQEGMIRVRDLPGV